MEESVNEMEEVKRRIWKAMADLDCARERRNVELVLEIRKILTMLLNMEERLIAEREAIDFAGTILARHPPTHLSDEASAPPPPPPPLSAQPSTADILSEIRSLALAVQSAAQAVESMIGLRIAQKRIGTLRRGTSHAPTPETATPLPDVIDRGLRANISETNRYGRLFREYAVHFSSAVNVTWSRLRLMVTHRGTEVYSCPAHPHNVKNAYCLFRLLDNNIGRFVFYLREHEDQVPNVFAGATPENYSDIDLDDDDEV